MRFLFTTLQTYESEFYGTVGAELERRGHESAHISVSRRAARLLRERGLEARCLLDSMDEPADLEAEVRRIEATYPIPHIREVYYADRVNAGKPEEWAIRRTVRHFRALERLVDELRPGRARARGRKRDDPRRHSPGRSAAQDPGALPPLHDLPEPAPPLGGHAARSDRRAGGAARADRRRSARRSRRSGAPSPSGRRRSASTGAGRSSGGERSSSLDHVRRKRGEDADNEYLRAVAPARDERRRDASGRGRRGRSTTTSRAFARSSTSRSTSPTTTRSGR